MLPIFLGKKFRSLILLQAESSPMMNKKLSLLAAAAFAGITSVVAAQDVQTGATEKTPGSASDVCTVFDTQRQILSCAMAKLDQAKNIGKQLKEIIETDPGIEKDQAFSGEYLDALGSSECMTYGIAGAVLLLDSRSKDTRTQGLSDEDFIRTAYAYFARGGSCMDKNARALEKKDVLKDVASRYRHLADEMLGISKKVPQPSQP
jgi:hypothetical protein